MTPLLLLMACAGRRAPEPPPPPQGDTRPVMRYDAVPVPDGWASAPFSLTMHGGSADNNAVELDCANSGWRQRAALVNGRARIDAVPVDDCVLWFKGGAPARFSPVRGGQDLACSIVGTSAICEESQPTTTIEGPP